MSELAELLELLHGSQRRYRTLRATVAFGHGEAEEVTRLWLEPPARVREEPTGSNAPYALAIRDGERWWIRNRDGSVDSNEDDITVSTSIGPIAELLFQPEPLIAELSLEPTGEAVVAGRPARLARGIPTGSRGRFRAPVHALDVDEIELAIDLERGVLLRRLTRRNGSEYVVEVRKIEFDATFADDTFEPPPAPERSERPQAVELTLVDAAARASFTVWAPPPLQEWELTAHYYGGNTTTRADEVVFFRVWRPDGRQIFVDESAAEAPDWNAPPGKWERRELDEQPFEVIRPADQIGQQVAARMIRGSTRLGLLSRTVPLETVLELARALRPIGAA
jgi:outer membrane lipoprotein-sorting protein